MAKVQMRVSLTGTIRNAICTLTELRDEVRRRDGWTEESNADDPAGSADLEIFSLSEVARHAEETKRGEHSIEQFAEFYCLKDRE